VSSSSPADPPVAPPAPPPAAADLFGAALPAVEAYAAILATVGVERGLLGPRETGRLWDRHLLNSALLCELVPADAAVVDVGSGGGLPGLVVALARPDLRLTLVDSMLRRTTFLQETVAQLGLADRVTVVRGRVEELRGIRGDVVLARAVADLASLARWTARACRSGGVLLVLRGEGANAEVAEHAVAVRRTGWKDVDVVERSADGVTPSRVIRAVRV